MGLRLVFSRPTWVKSVCNGKWVGGSAAGDRLRVGGWVGGRVGGPGQAGDGEGWRRDCMHMRMCVVQCTTGRNPHHRSPIDLIEPRAFRHRPESGEAVEAVERDGRYGCALGAYSRYIDIVGCAPGVGAQQKNTLCYTVCNTC